MSNDGLSARALDGVTAAITDRPSTRRAHPPRSRRSILRLAAANAVAALALAACSSNAGVAGATGTPVASAPAETASPSAEASASAAANRTMITFQEINSSKVFGGGVLSDLGDGSTAVTIGVVAIGFKDPLTAEIIAADCENLPYSASAAPSTAPSAAASMAASAAASEAASVGPSTAPTPASLPIKLNDVKSGSSNTVVQIGLADLLGSTSAIVLHKSAADPSVVACADVTATAAASSSAPSEAPSALPSASTAP
jgi:hypothetical protein